SWTTSVPIEWHNSPSGWNARHHVTISWWDSAADLPGRGCRAGSVHASPGRRESEYPRPCRGHSGRWVVFLISQDETSGLESPLPEPGGLGGPRHGRSAAKISSPVAGRRAVN